jgi:hypothetical protein
MKKWLAGLFVTGAVMAFIGCSGNKTPASVIIPPDTTHTTNSGTIVTLDNFDAGSAQTSLGMAFGNYKVLHMTDAGKSADWGGGHWYAYGSGNGAKVISDVDTILNGTQTMVDDTIQIAKMMSDGHLMVELNCQNLTGDFWAGIGCDLAGDLEHPFKFDSLKYPGDSSVYWDLTSVDSIRFKMSGIGSIYFYFESKAVVGKFPTPDDAYGFHGDTMSFGADTTSRYFSFSVKNFKTFSPEAASVTWDVAKTNISGFNIEVNTENDDFAELNIDKIELVCHDTVVTPFSFLK